MSWHGWALTDVGQERDHNEDRFYLNNKTNVYIIADGMGGVAGGEVAAQMVIDELPKLIEASLKEQPDISSFSFQTLVQEDFHSLNDCIYRHGVEIGLYGMGSTCVLALIQAETLLVAHVGDSRCYHLHQNKLNQITEDHNCPTDSYQLTRVLGSEEAVQCDLNLVSLSEDDRILLCSDGLNHMVSDEVISTKIKSKSGSTICRTLVKCANKAGGYDNTTCIFIGKNN